MFTKVSILHENPVFRQLGKDGKEIGIVCSTEQPDFLVNANGFVLNDISALTAAQSAQEAELLLKRIQVYQANNPDTSGMSVTDMIRSVSPRSAQCPSEIARAAEYIGQALQEKVDAKVSAKVAKAHKAAAEKVAAEKPAPQYTQPETT